jgi:hypothetical protein
MGGLVSKSLEGASAQLAWYGIQSLGMYVAFKFVNIQNNWMCEGRQQVQQVLDIMSSPGSVVCNVLVHCRFEHVCTGYVLLATCTPLLATAYMWLSPCCRQGGLQKTLWKCRQKYLSMEACFLEVQTCALSVLFILAWCCPVAWSPNHAIGTLAPESTVLAACAVCFLQTGCAAQLTPHRVVISIITSNLIVHGLGSAVRAAPITMVHQALLLLAKITSDIRVHRDIQTRLYVAYAVNAMLPSSWPETQHCVMVSMLLLASVAIVTSKQKWGVSWDAFTTLACTMTLPNEQVIATPWALRDLYSSMQSQPDREHLMTVLSDFKFSDFKFSNTMHALSVLCGQQTYVLRLGVWALTCMLACRSSDAQRTRYAMLIMWCVSLCNLFYATGLPDLLGFWLQPANGYLTTFRVVEQTCAGGQNRTFAQQARSQEKDWLRKIFGWN